MSALAPYGPNNYLDCYPYGCAVLSWVQFNLLDHNGSFANPTPDTTVFTFMGQMILQGAWSCVVVRGRAWPCVVVRSILSSEKPTQSLATFAKYGRLCTFVRLCMHPLYACLLLGRCRLRRGQVPVCE